MKKESLSEQTEILMRRAGAIKNKLARTGKYRGVRILLGRAEENLLYAAQDLRGWEAYCKEDAETVRIHEPLSENKT